LIEAPSQVIEEVPGKNGHNGVGGNFPEPDRDPSHTKLQTIDSRPSIIYLEDKVIGAEIKGQLHHAMIWVYRNRRNNEENLVLPEEFSHIAQIVPFVYRQPQKYGAGIYCEGDMLESHDTVKRINGFPESIEHLFSGFRISFNRYSDWVLVFSEHFGLSPEAINELYKRSGKPEKEAMMPLSADFRIIYPDP